MSNEWIGQLNAPDMDVRIEAVRELKKMLDSGAVAKPDMLGYTNNHVHTKYSFSPYSPAKAVWAAYMSGLSTVGIIDHDAINGAPEFIEVGEILGIATTIGFEIRTDWSDTLLRGKRINNPDQISNAYISAHGLPHTQIEKADAFLSGVRGARGQRNRQMVRRLNEILNPHGIALDYDADVVPGSYSRFGGEVTERHLLFAVTHKLIQKFGREEKLTGFLTGALGIPLNDTQRAYLADTGSDNFDYDLLNILKGSFVSRMYIDTDTAETPPVEDAVAFMKELGAIPTYCYLGDVAASPTGDKAAQTFEDAYLEDVFLECRRIGFDAIAYMPSRNTLPQLQRVMAMCEKHGFMQISGEDINQLRQSFICKQLKDPSFAHLTDTTWALVGHEISATKDIQNGMFAQGAARDTNALKERIDIYKRIGSGADR